ncbi:MAG: glutathione S-transferase N-terminal domain-containing protein [Hyphomicrobiaceae bacterium]
MIEMYDLAAADPAVRFSPYCWRTRMALAHKGLEVATIAWRFTNRDALAFSGQGRVPVIRDGKTVVFDSWEIARYLERQYPDRPSLFGGPKGEAHARFLNCWADGVLNPGLIRLVIGDVYAVIAEQDRDYFLTSRTARFGAPPDRVQATRDESVAGFRQSLAPLRTTLEAQSFLGGDEPSYADYIVFGGFMWARNVSDFETLEASDPIAAWRERMLDLHGGLGRNAPRARST